MPGAGQTARQHGLSHAGQVLDQHVPACKQTDDREFHGLPLPDDHLLDVGDDALGEGFEVDFCLGLHLRLAARSRLYRSSISSEVVMSTQLEMVRATGQYLAWCSCARSAAARFPGSILRVYFT